MDQLYTYEILQELRSYDNTEFFIDIIWPTIVTAVTIFASVYLSKMEFNRSKNDESYKQKTANERIRRIVQRNVQRVQSKVDEEVIKFEEKFIDGYNIEKGITMYEMLFLFPELDMLNSLDTLRLEEIFVNQTSTDEDVSHFYFAIAGITGIKETYNKISEEVTHINSFISSYDTMLLREFENIKEFLEITILNYQKDQTVTDKLSDQEIKNFYKLVGGYSSNINNFADLKMILEKIDTLDLSKKVMELNFMQYSHIKSGFFISYFKYQQEVFLFHDRIKYLTHRLRKLSIQIGLFSAFK